MSNLLTCSYHKHQTDSTAADSNPKSIHIININSLQSNEGTQALPKELNTQFCKLPTATKSVHLFFSPLVCPHFSVKTIVCLACRQNPSWRLPALHPAMCCVQHVEKCLVQSDLRVPTHGYGKISNGY